MLGKRIEISLVESEIGAVFLQKVRSNEHRFFGGHETLGWTEKGLYA
jgi:hypothetical protein